MHTLSQLQTECKCMFQICDYSRCRAKIISKILLQFLFKTFKCCFCLALMSVGHDQSKSVYIQSFLFEDNSSPAPDILLIKRPLPRYVPKAAPQLLCSGINVSALIKFSCKVNFLMYNFMMYIDIAV